ncbi:MAG: MMPL family transporter [Bacteroidetes bacterium]|nr:MMPL family transporter [Fibrella sp.]
MFWNRVSLLILKNRVAFVIGILLATVFMGFHASRIQLSYELAKILPVTDPDFQLYESFKARYGEDGNVMVVTIESDSMYRLPFFTDWYRLNQDIRGITGIKDVVSNANLFRIIRNDSLERFQFLPIIKRPPTAQAEVDSVRSTINRLPFYEGFVSDSADRAHLMAVTFDQSQLNSKGRIEIVRDIEARTTAFGERHNLTVHLSGLPYIRTEITSKVSNELFLFLGLAVLITAVILLLLFRSPTATLTALLVVGIGVVWSVGYTELFGYKITLLTGLIPPIIIVIGVPNIIFLLNRYREELANGHDRTEALRIAVEKVGETTFFANVTTSIGFFVFYFTNSPLLLEFGLVASLSIMTTYVVSLILGAAALSYLPVTSLGGQGGQLANKHITAFLAWVNHMVHSRRNAIYTFIAVAVGVGVIGLLRIEAIGYVVDDLPKNDPIYTDLKFIESRFKGVIPFEISVNTKRPGRVLAPQTLTKLKLLQREMEKNPEFTRPISLVEAIKFFYQAYRGGDPKYYVLPGALELNKLAAYAPQLKGRESRLSSFLDSTRQYTRVSYQMPDAGTVRTNQLVDQLQPRIDSIFNFDRETGQMVAPDERYDVRITGNSVVFTKGNEYLIRNLEESTALAILLISIILALLLKDIRLSLIAILPSIVPLVITAGIMGYAGIHLKPSTILIFSIAFGISSDGTIYFITKYRDEIRSQGASVAEAITRTIRYTGVSMFYTAMILFAGFAIFAASTFQGTAALGILVSITLLMGMASNLILLPAFLMTVEKRRARKVVDRVV